MTDHIGEASTAAPRNVAQPASTPAVGVGTTRGLLAVLALLTAIAPIAVDLYLPAFPTMTTDLRASATTVQLTLTAFLVGITLGQLAFGVLSDRFGRFGPLVTGALLCVAASACVAAAPTIEAMIAARFAQGFTGAAGMVIGRAIVSDLATGKAAARAFSLMMIVGGVAPVVAPFAGSLLVHPIGWRGILWAVCAMAAITFVASVLVIRESHPRERRAAMKKSSPQSKSSRPTLRSRAYAANTVTFGFGFAVMMAYISASPFVYQVMIGLTPIQYGAVFGTNALGLIVVSAISGRLAMSRSVPRLLGVGVSLVFGGTVVLLTLVLTGAPVGLLPIPIFVAVASLGLVLGNATALALTAVPRVAGRGSAVLGALQFALAAMVSPLVNLGGAHSALPMAVVMVVLAAVALGSYLMGTRPGTAPTSA